MLIMGARMRTPATWVSNSRSKVPGVVGHVGGSAPHVETDHLVVTGQARGARHADDAAGRAGQDRVLALEHPGVGQAAGRLHEEQLHARHLGRHLLDIAAQDGR
jgi:hypothetical protein